MLLRTLAKGHGAHHALGVAFSPNGALLAAASAEHAASLYAVDGMHVLCSLL